MFSVQILKRLLYLCEAFFGLFLCCLSLYMVATADQSLLPIVYEMPAAISMLVGLACILFGVDTLMLSEDPDIWR